MTFHAIPPCRRCGSRDFELAIRSRTDVRNGKRPLVRRCANCQRRHARAYRARNLDACRARERSWHEAKRAVTKAERAAVGKGTP